MITPIKDRRKVVGYTVSCDDCTEGYDMDTDSFDEVREKMKKDGWSTSKANGFWKNRCPDCRNKFNERFYHD